MSKAAVVPAAGVAVFCAAMGAPPRDLYDTAFVRGLFDAMSASYERVNTLTSFGFSTRWRRQCVEQLGLVAGERVLDWMTGMGEGWPYILDAIGTGGTLAALDLSPGMLAHARRRRLRHPAHTIELTEADVLAGAAPSASADAIVSLFGVKTMSEEMWRRLAAEVARVLRPGGRFSFIDVSVPPSPWLRVPYLFYLKRVIPLLGALLLGNPETYRMLGVYTERFGDCRRFAAILAEAGLEVRHAEYFFGCASGVCGRRPG